MNAFQQMQKIEQNTVAQIDAATTAIEKIGRGPVDDACTRLEFACEAAASRLAEGPARAADILTRFLGRMAGAATAAVELLGEATEALPNGAPTLLLTDATKKPARRKD